MFYKKDMLINQNRGTIVSFFCVHPRINDEQGLVRVISDDYILKDITPEFCPLLEGE